MIYIYMIVNNKQHLDQTYEAGDVMDDKGYRSRFPFFGMILIIYTHDFNVLNLQETNKHI